MTGDLHTSYMQFNVLPGSFFLIREGISLGLFTSFNVKHNMGSSGSFSKIHLKAYLTHLNLHIFFNTHWDNIFLKCMSPSSCKYISMPLIAPLPLTTILAFTDSCLPTFTFNPIHYCGPPSIHSSVRGDKSSAKYGCLFVLLDLWSPPLGILHPFLASFSSSAHT